MAHDVESRFRHCTILALVGPREDIIRARSACTVQDYTVQVPSDKYHGIPRKLLISKKIKILRYHTTITISENKMGSAIPIFIHAVVLSTGRRPYETTMPNPISRRIPNKKL